MGANKFSMFDTRIGPGHFRPPTSKRSKRMATVRAKFVVTEVTRRQHWQKDKGEIQTIKLAPVTSGNAENESFYAATPSGNIELGTVNAEAAKEFNLGQAFYVDFTPADV